MKTTTLTAKGNRLDISREKFGELRSSIDVIDDREALLERMKEDGYLYLPQCLNRKDVLAARMSIFRKMAEEELLEPGTNLMEGIPKADYRKSFRPQLARGDRALQRMLYAGPMLEFYNKFLGGEIRHFDYTWLRAVAPGDSSNPHCDIVYMSRGTTALYTSWTPLGDIPKEMG